MGSVRYIGLAALLARGQAATVQAVAESANHLLGEVVEHTPLEEGTLRGSEHVIGPEVRGNVVEAKVATGGEASDYAIVQHEHEEFAHPLAGEAKYMEGPLIEHRPLHLEAMRRAASQRF